MVRRVDALQQCTWLADLCFLPLWIVCLACRYFRLSVNWAFTCQVLFFWNILVNTLCPSSLLTCYTCLCLVVGTVNKLRLQYKGTTKYLGESVTGMKFRLRKRQRGLDAFIVTGDSSMDAGRCADELWHFLCTCAVVFPPEDQSRWLWHHEIIIIVCQYRNSPCCSCAWAGHYS